ncbi:keratin-associated protein 10-4-like isoform X2 [Erpetoichthys calabaricus]|uniref:keratin-associated protein 10-4-like isoform X2 n=1 Tax=Erpetoichthys calabaricus TaxID=27687 RepID=UPI0022349FF9|nr:keratin-associated protein 10-4-like isoform X2 [Erpetoichthys calabaricus]
MWSPDTAGFANQAVKAGELSCHWAEASATMKMKWSLLIKVLCVMTGSASPLMCFTCPTSEPCSVNPLVCSDPSMKCGILAAQITLANATVVNGLLCYSGISEPPLQCKGMEDHCFTANTDVGVLNGCASINACDSFTAIATYLKATAPSSVSCCQGSMCNSPQAGPASSITCYLCTSVDSWTSCTDVPTNCSDVSMECGAVAVQEATAQSTQTKYSHACLNRAFCNLTASINVGIQRGVFTSQCCSSPLCNGNAVQVNATPENGLECYSEFQNVRCLGIEDRCVNIKVQNLTFSGCASKSACDNVQSLGSYLGLAAVQVATCCEGSMCNSPVPFISCFSCNGPDLCSQNCISPLMTCGITEAQTVQNGHSQSRYVQNCASPQICNATLSFLNGTASTTFSSQCCSSDLCNTATVTQANMSSLKCKTGIQNDCMEILPCKGHENRCFTIGLQDLGVVRGCASKATCDGITNPAAILFGLFKMSTTSAITCCEENECNSIGKTLGPSAASTLPLLTVLLFFY